MKIRSVRLFPIHLRVKPEFYIVSSAGAHAVSHYVIVAVEAIGLLRKMPADDGALRRWFRGAAAISGTTGRPWLPL